MTFAIGSRPGERRGSKPPGVFLYAIRLDGDDLGRDRLEVRKATLASILAKASPAIRFKSISKATAKPSSPMPARWDSKALFRSVRTPPIVPATRPTGSKSPLRLLTPSSPIYTRFSGSNRASVIMVSYLALSIQIGRRRS
jgi:hypothetical protein